MKISLFQEMSMFYAVSYWLLFKKYDALCNSSVVMETADVITDRYFNIAKFIVVFFLYCRQSGPYQALHLKLHTDCSNCLKLPSKYESKMTVTLTTLFNE